MDLFDHQFTAANPGQIPVVAAFRTDQVTAVAVELRLAPIAADNPIGIGGYALQLEERSKDLCGKLFLTFLWSGFWLHRLQRCDPAETSPPRTGGVLQERDNVLFVHTGGLFAQDWEV